MYKPKQENGFTDPSAAAFDPVLEPSFPKSLYLIQPLFSSHELNPVASIAQASVPVPDGLDLDAWIVPSMQDRVAEEGDDGDVTERKIKRNKKGKEKESASRTKVKSGKKKQKEEGYREELAPQEEETAEEKAERERVGIDHNLHIPSTSLTFHSVRPNDWNECGTTHTTSWTTDLKSLLQRMSIQYPLSD
jgi:AP-3 complex subunit delta-1